MKYLILSVLLTLTLSLTAKEKIVYEVGDELKLKRDNSVVLFYYKHDAIELNLNREFIDSPYGLFIDARDLYRIKKGEKIGKLNVFIEDNLHSEYDVFSNEDIKRSNIFSRILKSLNFLVWGDA